MDEASEKVPLTSDTSDQIPLNRRSSESAPLSATSNKTSFFPINTTEKTFGSNFFLFTTLIGSIIPILQLIVGANYIGSCPINQNIPIYMVVAGCTGLGLAALSLLLSITFMCLLKDSTSLSAKATCGIGLNIIAMAILSLFCFAWFIVGCVWVFSINGDVNYSDIKSRQFCAPVLYKSAFGLLIVTIIWAFVQCCLSCFRQCCPAKHE